MVRRYDSSCKSRLKLCCLIFTFSSGVVAVCFAVQQNVTSKSSQASPLPLENANTAKIKLMSIDSLSLELFEAQKIVNEGEQIIWFTVVNDEFATTYLPTYLESFRRTNATLVNNIVVVTLSEKARGSCLKIHHACPKYDKGSSGHIPNALQQSTRSAQQPAWRNLVWVTVELRLHIARMGFSTLHSDADVFHLQDPWKLLLHVAKLRENVAVSTNAISAKLVDANPGVHYCRSGNHSVAYLMKWYEHRKLMGSTSGNQRALTSLLAKERWMARATEVLPCSLIASGCCLRDCCVSLWQRLETMDHATLYSEVSSNANLAWVHEAPIFHAACMGGTPEKKMRRLTKFLRAISK